MILQYYKFYNAELISITELPIEIIVPLKETECVENSIVTLTCEVNKPNVKARWLKDNVEITPNENRQITVDGTVHKMTFPKVALDDEAEYTILIGDKKSSAVLFVEGE